MNTPITPERWAADITHLLNTAFGADRFPIDVAMVAQEFSKQRYPQDRIVAVEGGDLPTFDGALYPIKSKGWAVIYNNAISSKGRINFTLAHEFGHYLLHRLDYPEGFRCGPQQIVRWDSEIGQIEHQANVFAASLLMPLDDFRRQISAKAKVDFDMFQACRERYQVSLVAAVLRWLSYTEKRAILVVSRDGFILWARSSKAALQTGAYFKTVDQPPIEIPASSLPLNPMRLVDGKGSIDHMAGVWLPEPVREMTILAEQYDFSLSLLLLDDRAGPTIAEDEPVEDTFDRFTQASRRREW
ncbi:MAG: ImmA/IrrE family metallo-endopeptidase [Hyphomicrobium sp.]|jgi:Zn-dependent peptidase ImmA (M78 family)|uniref:ImmA/IrrE family metallo-endopeptidase n=1 Tax=Hyphomicrobium sp. TaxID=82 RepID=UPI0025C11212|nr:ImmA/IrrE family metallo-endopeptidase [Hyphomicrobium sp.]MBX9862370.1 ImmA/IrrE family metallo-endopeptidase [Hyphomicrobium sp.]